MTKLTRRNFFKSLIGMGAGVTAGVLLPKIEIDEPEEEARIAVWDGKFWSEIMGLSTDAEVDEPEEAAFDLPRIVAWDGLGNSWFLIDGEQVQTDFGPSPLTALTVWDIKPWKEMDLSAEVELILE